MGIDRQVVLRILYAAPRWLGWSAVVLYFAAAFIVLGIRHLLLPNIDHYKPQIEARLSTLLGAEVRLGEIKAQWHRHLRLQLRGVQFSEHGGTDASLTVPEVDAVLSWRSLWRMQPQFLGVHLRGLDLSLRRDAQRRLWLLGHRLPDPAVQDRDASGPGLEWLLQQPHITVQNARLRWVDESRDATPLVFDQVNLQLLNGARYQRFALSGQPADAVGGRFDLRAEVPRTDSGLRDVVPGAGRYYLHIDGLRPPVWRAWLEWPSTMQSEHMSVQTWLERRPDGAMQVTADLSARQFHWQISDTHGIAGGTIRVFAQGGWDDETGATLKESPMASLTSGVTPVSFQLAGQNVQLLLPEHYEHPLAIDTLSTTGTARSDKDGYVVQFAGLRLSNDDIAGQLDGEWRSLPADPFGRIDAHGQVRRAALPAVHRYMPRWLDSDVRSWLEHGLLAGQVVDAELVLRGNLSSFPYNQPEDEGEFRIRGSYRNAVVDYLPPDDTDAGWPRLDAMNGELALRDASLEIHARTAQIHPQADAILELADVNARIADLTHDPVLEVSGQSQGDASAYLAFMRRSPLGGFLNGVFDTSQAQGDWDAPLALTIPLTRVDDTTLRGEIGMKNAWIQFAPQLPRFDAVTGRLEFTESLVHLPDVSARFLGGPVRISGSTAPDANGLRMAGKLDPSRLDALIPVPGMARITGQTEYTATLTGIGKTAKPQTPVLRVQSNLEGIDLNFPPPLAKSATQAWPLDARWTLGKDGKRQLDMVMNDTFHVQLQHDPAQSAQSYFQRGSLGVQRVPDWPSAGMLVDIAWPVFDADDWDAITKEFSAPDTEKSSAPIFPTVLDLRLRTDHGHILGLELDELTYTAKRQAPDAWRVDVSSTQTAGTMTWKEVDGEVKGPVQAVFHRLALGDEHPPEISDMSDDEAADEPVPEDFNVPAINLLVENLTLYGRPLGKLSVVGHNQGHGHIWRLDQLSLSSPSAHLEGSGLWRLRGPQRGLTLDADVDVSDLGDYVDQIGFADMLAGGEGRIQGSIEWRDLPWSFDKSHINGHIGFEFAKGRLSTVNSKSARLLELLSIQSVRRLATLDLNSLIPGNDGFPYDMLRGSLKLQAGRVRTEDYRIVGPVGTIVLDGLVHLATGKLDLRAVVVPNLDVSGAALAAGIAINPVVGLGAFLTQWLLKAPLANAMTAQYEIGGDWDDPKITPVERLAGSVNGKAEGAQHLEGSVAAD